jgi:large subunit ribosomal protein L6
MSRIGKSPITVPKGVDVKVNGFNVAVKGPKGQIEREVHSSMKVVVDGGAIKVVPSTEDVNAQKLFGLTRTLLANMVHGVTEGFTKSLTLVGVGYRAAAKGKGITLNLGYSHPIDFDPPKGVELKVDKQTIILISGADKHDVGQVAATLRGLRPPEPYHGKGVRYSDEVIATKVGKAAGKK